MPDSAIADLAGLTEATDIATRSPEEPAERSDLYRRILWLSAFRVAAVSVLVGTTALVSLRGSDPLGAPMMGLLSALAVATNLLQIGVVVVLRKRQALGTLATVQIVGDVVFSAVLVYLTGVHESLFSFLYLLAIVDGSILLSSRGAWTAAGLSLFADWTQVLLVQAGLMGHGLAVHKLALPDLIQTLFIHGSAFTLTAGLSGYLARLLEREGLRASAAESTLSELHTLHDAIVRSIASGIVTANADDRITFLNRAGEEILDLPLHAVRGLPLGQVFPGLLGATANARESPLTRRLETSWGRPGTEKVLGFTVTPLMADDGGSLGTATVFQDLTRFRDLEMSAARSERLAALGKLAAGLAHELRNPLASISGSVELLASGAPAGAEDRKLLEIVMREADRLSKLVSEFLAFARPAPPRTADVSLPELVREVLRVFEVDPHGKTLSRSENLAPAVARADASQLKQVLWNLLLNAAEATPRGGNLTLATGTAGPGQVFVRVVDSGSGIGPEDVDRIFDPFFTTKADGTGLGLATVHRVVEAHRGRIEVDSRPGKGARFTVILPAATEA